MAVSAEELNGEIKSKTAEQILKWAFEKFGNRITFASSFGAEDVVIIDMIHKINPNTYIFTLDTGRLPEETYRLMDTIRNKYGIKITSYFPDAKQVEQLVNNKGFYSFKESVENRKECCRIRKVEPMKRALAGMSAWITGLRKEQSVTRRDIAKVEEDNILPGLIKINPLADWSNEQVWDYIKKNNVPYNKLHDIGYASIGCEPCTRAIKPGEDMRAGRWWWENSEAKECGLHIKPITSAKKDTDKKEIHMHGSDHEAEDINSHLNQLENQSIYIIREGYKKFRDVAVLWSMGKDSTVLLWLVRKAFFGKVPFPCIHCDTTYKFKEMIEFREKYAKEWNLDLIVSTNTEALTGGMGPEKGKFNCCTALKTTALQSALAKYGFKGLFVGIRRDEEGSRGKERYFSPRAKDLTWNYKEQPPELWDQFKTDFAEGTHVRIHPLLHWSELDLWMYIKREKIPVLPLYFAKNGKRYRSVGCYPCTFPVVSTAQTIDEIIEELKSTKVAERAGRAHDKEHAYMMQRLRTQGFM